MTKHANKLYSGFGLIEAAIVLTVVGIVIGGIWVAISNVNDKANNKKLFEEVMLTVSNIRQTMLGDNSDRPSGNLTLQNVLNMGAYPKHMPVIRTDPGNPNVPYVRHAHGGVFFATSGADPTGNGFSCAGFNCIMVVVSSLSRSACIQLLTQIAPTARAARNIGFAVAFGGPHFQNLETTPIASTNLCTSDNNGLLLHFRIHY